MTAIRTVAALVLATGLAAAEEPRAVYTDDTESGTTTERDVAFARRATVGETDLVLRGTGSLRYWGFLVYTAGLYAPPDALPDDDIAAQPHMIRLHYHRSLTEENFRESTTEGIEKNSRTDAAKLADPLDEVNDLYRDVKQGDEYRVVYDPEVGVSLYFNETFQGTITGGEDFARAYLGIWIGPEALSSSMRDKLWGVDD